MKLPELQPGDRSLPLSVMDNNIVARGTRGAVSIVNSLNSARSPKTFARSSFAHSRHRPTMTTQDWHVTNGGECIVPSSEILVDEPIVPYRLYRFLTDLEEILLKDSDDQRRLQKIAPLVRHLLDNSPWLELQFLPPDPDKGWSVNMLYDEPDYPLTVQMVSWLPGVVSPIHNHGTWGLVAILNGSEKNTFWTVTDHGLEQTGEQVLAAGDVITFMPQAIHSIEALGDEPVVSFNLYGETDFEQRFRFDAKTGVAEPF